MRGQILFPNQSHSIGAGRQSFVIPAEKIWGARAARINSVDQTDWFRSVPAAAEMWKEASNFPRHVALYLVGCINYQFADNQMLHQTSFMASVMNRQTGGSFSVLSGTAPERPSLRPVPCDPDTMMVQARWAQRIVPGDQIGLNALVDATFAD